MARGGLPADSGTTADKDFDLKFEISDLKSEMAGGVRCGVGNGGGRLRAYPRWHGVPHHPNPMASQARHESVSPRETNASRFVVPQWGRGRRNSGEPIGIGSKPGFVRFRPAGGENFFARGVWRGQGEP